MRARSSNKGGRIGRMRKERTTLDIWRRQSDEYETRKPLGATQMSCKSSSWESTTITARSFLIIDVRLRWWGSNCAILAVESTLSSTWSIWSSSSTGNFQIKEHEEWWKIVHKLKCTVIPAVITIDGMPRSDGGTH